MPNKSESLNGNSSRRSRAGRDFLAVIDAELRRLAAEKMGGKRGFRSFDAAMLVQEAYVRLGGEKFAGSSSMFFRTAAESMRQILVERALARRAEQRWSEFQRLNLGDSPASPGDGDLLALDEALTDLDRHDPIAAELIKLRFFSGFSVAEAARLLRLTRRQGDNRWKLARAWLFRWLNS